MSKKTPLSYPEREVQLVLSAAKSAGVFDAAVSAGLLAEHITQPPLAAIWSGIVAQRDGGEETVRSAPLREHLRAARMEEAARPYVHQIRDTPVPTERQALDDANRIVAAAKARSSGQALSVALAELNAADDAQAALAILQDRAFGIVVDQERAREKRSLHKVLSGLVQKIADPAQRARRVSGIPTHIAPLDAKTRGDQLGKVTIIGARPGAGKTAFTTSILAEAVERNDPTIHPMDPTLFFSLEMDDEELVARVMCAMAGIEYEAMMYGPKPDADMSRRLVWAADCINASPLEIDDETPRTVEQIAAEIYRWHRRVFRGRKTRGKVVIDYLTRIKRSPGIKNLQDHVMHCMAVLADVAKRTGLAIDVLSQLTRGHVKEGRMPEMDDLKGGGDVEENAFHVILLHPLGKSEDAAAGRPWRGSVAAMVEKNRAGPTGMVMLKFDGAKYKFRAWNNEADGSLDDVLGSMSNARPGAPKYNKPTQKKLPLAAPPAHPSPGSD